MILLLKTPLNILSTSEVLLSVIDGVIPVLQQTPQAITVEPSSTVMLPPHVAVVIVILETLVVVITGTPSFLQPFVR